MDDVISHAIMILYLQRLLIKIGNDMVDEIAIKKVAMITYIDTRRLIVIMIHCSKRQIKIAHWSCFVCTNGFYKSLY